MAVRMSACTCMPAWLREREASGAWGWGQEVEVSLYINFKLLHGTTSRRNSL